MAIGADMNKNNLSTSLLSSQIIRLAIAILLMPAWSSFTICGEIHEAARQGDLARVKALLKDNPGLVSSEDTVLYISSDNNKPPLHYAVIQDHKDVVVFLLANKAEVNVLKLESITPLRLATVYCKKGDCKDVVECLRQHGGHE